ncbi:MAG: histidinol-phosphatase [Clostridia bacterium]|nr:histidinol-phosphatase [Clostridia bacterium]
MKTNYHAHTHRCNHAETGERRYIEAALKEGFKIFGFADHVPQPYTDFRSGMRMQPEETADYVNTLCALKEEYRGEIDVHIGFEAEYFPALFDDLLRLLEPYPYEYLMLGQHFLDHERGGTYVAVPCAEEAGLAHYVDQCAEALNTGAFSCFVHPDIFRFTGEEAVYRAQMRRLCREAKGCGVPLEYNLLGLGTHRHYPNPIFWEEAAAVGNKVILGWDAHAPSWLEQPQLEASAVSFLDSLGLRRIETLTLVRPRAKA